MTTNYYPLIEKILRSFNLRKNLSKKESLIAAESSFVTPFITVAREPGSGGAPIARRVAELLNFEYVDEQLVDEIAKSTKKRKSIISAVDEKARTQVQDLVHAVLNKEYVEDTKYVTELVRLILVYAHKGRTVILGRGGNFITPFAKGLHVNIVAPYEIRVQRAIDFEGHSREKAKQVIAEVEREREEFIRQYFNSSTRKRSVYDITINTAYFRVEEASRVIIAALKQKFSRSFPKLGIRI
jgi:cytidylate kinase